MACPYFYPLDRARASAPRDSMLPLGDCWTGVCRALPGSAIQAEEASLRRLCNLGYARGTCARFPVGDGPDAVRFTIARDEGAALRIAYVVERDHHPFVHGHLDYSAANDAFVERPGSDILERQARAYAESYRRRKI